MVTPLPSPVEHLFLGMTVGGLVVFGVRLALNVIEGRRGRSGPG
jgi:hypothetical protein